MARKPAASRHSKPDGGLDRLVALLQRGQLLLWPLCLFLFYTDCPARQTHLRPPSSGPKTFQKNEGQGKCQGQGQGQSQGQRCGAAAQRCSYR